jgi:hypothetical protein
MSSDDLTFHEAANQFRAFLAAEGWPTAITWVPASKVVRAAGQPITIESIEAAHEVQAAKDYDAARHRGLGVCFDAVCAIGETTCATVLWPVDPREAELLMYPSDGGLKMSVAVPRTEGRVR